jgi:hypothetical protein
MALIEGMNSEGRIKPRIRHLRSGVEAIDKLLPKQKRKRSFDFLLTPVKNGNNPWDW